MSQTIALGSKINVQIVKQPTNAAARKTLIRLLSKDRDTRVANNHLQQVRKVHHDPQPRGGRLYGGRLVKKHLLQGKVGEAGTLLASVDVITDLRSVEQFVHISNA